MKALGLILMSLVNREREFWSLPPVRYDFALEKYLYNNVTNNGSWFYESGPETVSWDIEGHTRYCDLRGFFLKPLGFNYQIRDTFRDSVPRIFRQRLSQGRVCKKTVFADGDKCSWFYAYHPVLMSNYTRFACKTLNFQGRYVPDYLRDKQMRSFFCYFDGSLYFLKNSK
jgi:hypothetical protein